MTKTCKEIARDIEELKRKLQQNRLVEMALVDFFERKKCLSNIATETCLNCNCWKSVRENRI
jgi:hypothetical protein